MARFTWDHLHLRSPDPEASARFYVEMFGAEITGRTGMDASLRVVVGLSGLSLFIERVPPETPAPPEPPFLGLEHFGLAVTGLDELARELKGKGAEFIVEPWSPKPGVRIAFLRGPENVRIELLERIGD